MLKQSTDNFDSHILFVENDGDVDDSTSMTLPMEICQ